MSRMKDGLIDLTVTSPPYDNLRTYNGYSFDFESIAKELYRVTKEGGVVVWVVSDATIKGSETGTSFKQALYFKEIGFNLHDTMIYYKNPIFPSSNRYYQQFEYMFIFSKGKPNTFNPIMIDKADSTLKDREGRKNTEKGFNRGTHNKKDFLIRKNTDKKQRAKSNVWKITNGHSSSKDKIAFKHPAIFPEQLANDHIISWSNENDIVYDCFMGSGTTAKMALINNRKFIGSEMSAEYCEIAEIRISNYRINLFTK
tara:strand:- start:51 stop:818 length:768 start_codon:yes stop_codon:yes gene_type:complete